MSTMVEVFPSDPAKARDIHLRLLPLMSALMTLDPSPGPLKAALRQLGLPGGPVRPPLVDMDADGERAIADVLAAAGVTG
jgi:4-hydroxy-tetrahydrodipicolinate synthase